MTLTAIFTLIIGLFASAAIILSALSVVRSRLLFWSILAMALLVGQYWLTGSIVALAIISVSLLRNIVFYFAEIIKPLQWLRHWLSLVFFMVASVAVWILVNDFSKFDPMSLIPVVGSLLTSLAIFFKNLIHTKIVLILVGAAWVTYQFYVGAYGSMIGEAFAILSNSISLYILFRAKKHGVTALDPDTQAIQIITRAIPTITKAIPVITQKIMLPEEKSKAWWMFWRK